MDGAKEDLVDMFIVHTTEEIQVSGGVIHGGEQWNVSSNQSNLLKCI